MGTLQVIFQNIRGSVGKLVFGDQPVCRIGEAYCSKGIGIGSHDLSVIHLVIEITELQFAFCRRNGIDLTVLVLHDGRRTHVFDLLIVAVINELCAVRIFYFCKKE